MTGPVNPNAPGTPGDAEEADPNAGSHAGALPREDSARLRIEHTRPGELVVSGEIDTVTAEQLGQELDEAATGAPSLLVDLCAVTYLGSAGVAVLYDAACQNMRLRVTENTAVAAVMRICGLIHLAHVEFVG
jgi:anti-anti-sigma factor